MRSDNTTKMNRGAMARPRAHCEADHTQYSNLNIIQNSIIKRKGLINMYIDNIREYDCTTLYPTSHTIVGVKCVIVLVISAISID